MTHCAWAGSVSLEHRARGVRPGEAGSRILSRAPGPSGLTARRATHADTLPSSEDGAPRALGALLSRR